MPDLSPSTLDPWHLLRIKAMEMATERRPVAGITEVITEASKIYAFLSEGKTQE
jgi:hypothetical protein